MFEDCWSKIWKLSVIFVLFRTQNGPNQFLEFFRNVFFVFAQTLIEKYSKSPEILLNTNITTNKSHKAHDYDHYDDKDSYIEISQNHIESGRWS